MRTPPIAGSVGKVLGASGDTAWAIAGDPSGLVTWRA
jgi:hypothetical protein